MDPKQAPLTSYDQTSAIRADRLSADQISDEQIEKRKQWLKIDAQTEALVKTLDPILVENIDEIMDVMYDHFTLQEHTRNFFPNQEIIKRAKQAQTNYFLQLTKGKYDREYVLDRLKVGRTHYNIGLDTKWYMGAYCLVLNLLGERVWNRLADEPEKASRSVAALRKIIFFDMGLAIDTYNETKEKAIALHRDAIKELETESRVTKSILESAPLGIVRMSDDFRIIESNQEFADLTGNQSPENLNGELFFEVAGILPKDKFELAIQTGSPYQATGEPLFLGTSKDVRFFDWAVWPTKAEDGGISGLVAVFSNVSEMIKLLQQREDFVATLTHDLKTPIMAANRALRLLMEGDFGEVEDCQKDLIETILQSNDAMYQMVLTLLDVYKYDSGTKKLKQNHTDVVEAVKKMLNELTPLAESRKIELNMISKGQNEPVFCDWDEIRRVIQNLVDNSLKFTPPDGRIEIIIERTDTDTTISVVDNGKGISPDDIPKLFQRFWQASSGGRYYASTGLGLYLCRKIIESHGGTLICQSTLGHGSTFSFTLPNVDI